MVMADVLKHLQGGQVRVGFYDIEGTLGKGNFAVVKLGRHRITKTEARPGSQERPRLGSGEELFPEGERLQGSGAVRQAAYWWKREGLEMRTKEAPGAGVRRVSDLVAASLDLVPEAFPSSTPDDRTG
ncbi:Serine/Threonine-Protein Kinase Sik2 [Manis pentadactyla]|nr:Serine/Threonine-Protein Kinase Sik2 [Manis pentadactyla]